jgi:hypothetical protein
MPNIYRKCPECAFDIDIDSKVPGCQHKWHNGTWDDMCCLCGKDAEYIYK